MFKGSLPALVTPLTGEGKIDWPALERLVETLVRFLKLGLAGGDHGRGAGRASSA